MDKKENPLVFLINLFTLPFLRVGHWMSEKFSKINVFVFILDFIIEAPFKIFLEVIEDWIAFLKEKREEIYNKDWLPTDGGLRIAGKWGDFFV